MLCLILIWVELAVDREASGSGWTDSNASGTGAGSSLAEYNPDLDTNPNAESDLDTSVDFHDLPFHNTNDVNLGLPSPTGLTEHDALTAHEADDHLELHEQKMWQSLPQSTQSMVVKQSLLKERSVYFVR